MEILYTEKLLEFAIGFLKYERVTSIKKMSYE